MSNADIYQMLAYCTALQLSRGHLIYAEGEVVREWVEASPRRHERSGVRFTLLTSRHRQMIDEYVSRGHPGH